MMALHEQCVGATDEWYTPPHVFNAMGCLFDIDVSSPGRLVTPWIPAIRFITAESLSEAWSGFLWMNPPFGGRNGIAPWLAKFFEFRNGVALTPDRTSAPWWQRYAAEADAILFISPKLKFIGADGKPGKSPAQGTTLLAAGPRGMEALYRAEANGLGILVRRETSHPRLPEGR
jgi:DNA N-6-adenine-methyltransferase (Dam)